jgi:hypothetical protein
MRIAHVLAAAVAVPLFASVPAPEPNPDPAQNLARVRLFVQTKAAITDVTVSGATIASYISTVLDGPAGTRSSQTGQTMRTTNGAAGESAEARFDIILAGVVAGGTIRWNVTNPATTGTADTQLEVYALNDFDRPRLVDRFETSGTTAQFATEATLLEAHGPLHVTPVAPLVLAHYYPWYTRDTWRDPELADQPLQPYSTDDQTDVTGLAREARSAGIDAFVVSWQGIDVGDGVNDRRMRVVLEAGRRTGLRVSVLTETLVANSAHDPNVPTDPDTVLRWLEQIVDLYGSDPPYLRVAERPVIFIYQSWQLAPPQWADLRARLRATGRDPILIGDFYHSPELEPLDGEFQYSNVTLSADGIRDRDRVESLRVRTYNLLRPNDRRRLWIATVAPGYDDTLLSAREAHQTVDRAGGRVYADQWSAAVDTAADWIMITSWNEWWENTQIEPSRRYGSMFLDLTRDWANVFKSRQKISTAP